MDRIALGIIRRAHGVRGEASVELWTDSAARFDEIEAITLVSPGEGESRDLTIESVRAHGDRVLVKFSGIDSPEAVQSLQNWTIEIPESEARVLEEGEYFLHDLVGLVLVDGSGSDRGTVIEVLEGGGGVLLRVRRPDGKEYELPFASELCTSIDLESKRMEVNLPVGLDDLDGAGD